MGPPFEGTSTEIKGEVGSEREEIDIRGTRQRSSLILVASALSVSAGAGTARSTDANVVGAGSSFAAPLITAWYQYYNPKAGVERQLQLRRLRRRHRVDHRSNGRLRSERRAADAGSVRELQGLRSDSRRCSARPRSSTTSRASRSRSSSRGRSSPTSTSATITQWDDVRDQGAQHAASICRA